MSVLLYVHSNYGFFPFSLLSPKYQGNTHSLTITFVYLVDFQTTRKRTSLTSVLAGIQEPKNPNLYNLGDQNFSKNPSDF